jgi:hypothetical protein
VPDGIGATAVTVVGAISVIGELGITVESDIAGKQPLANRTKADKQAARIFFISLLLWAI